MRLGLLAWVALIPALVLSGCIGGDDDSPAPADPDDGGADEAVAQQGFGSLTGQVLSEALEPIPGTTIALTGSADPYGTLTDRYGRYTINGIRPGEYVFQAEAYGHRPEVRAVSIASGEIAELSLQLSQLSDLALGLPVVDSGEFRGFLACGVGQAILPVGNPVYPSGINPRLSPCGDLDANDRFLFEFAFQPGLQEVVMGMTWDPVGGLSGRELNLNLEVLGCDVTCTDDETYIDVAGPPDIVFQLRDEDVPPTLAFSQYNETKGVQIRVFPAATQTPNVIYQQPYAIYYEFYYNQFAPEGRTPIPDQ